MRSFEENLRLYAMLTVHKGVDLLPGQELILYAELDQQPFVHLIAQEAYRLGAKNVEIIWRDPVLMRMRLLEGSDDAVAYAVQWLIDGVARAHREGAARLGISSADPELMAGIPPEKVSISSKAHSLASREVSELVSSDTINWSLVGAASEGWAKRVFPGVPSQEAVARLWDAIFLSSRILEPDPLAAWVAHSEALEAKVRQLNDLRLDAVHFSGPGTDLRVGLVEGHLWAGGRSAAKNGAFRSANIPTEEVFTMPHRLRVDGVVRNAKPLSLRGQIVDGIEVEFTGGVAVKASASTGGQTLLDLLDSDEGARRLGEVALVPQGSRVGQTGILFLNSLFDENAASHIAFGDAYEENLEDGGSLSPEERLARGSNDSIIHVDWMIGSEHIDVDGVRGDGSVMPLMRSGEWV